MAPSAIEGKRVPNFLLGVHTENASFLQVMLIEVCKLSSRCVYAYHADRILEFPVQMGPLIKSVMWIPLVILTALLQKQATCSPLYANSRWIVDENGNRVKLACVSWVSHVNTMVAEGLNKEPLDDITKGIRQMGFNCVRLTWALFMFTDPSLGGMTVRESMRNLNLSEAEEGIGTYNPHLLDLSLVEAYKAVVASLGANGVMVILDNHVSKPEWCCSNSDGNGFFGDEYFNPDLWVEGLTAVASTFNATGAVVGMSLRNELRGPNQNQNDWYKYMQRGAEAVHSANPNVLVILSGLSFDKDLSFLSSKPVNLDFRQKLVYELHWYAFTDGQAWANGNPNRVCGSVTSSFINRGAFLITPNMTYTAPLFISEFGIDQRGTNANDNRYINCFLAFAAENDLDWAFWALQGSYYYRSGRPAVDETYGILDGNWTQPRNGSFLGRLSVLQKPFRGPGLSVRPPYQIIYHPATGSCLQRKSLTDEDVMLGPCTQAEAWNYNPQQNIVLTGTNFCLQARGVGMPAGLRIPCVGENTEWNTVSESGLHLSANLGNGTEVCLDGISSPSIVTNQCKCLSADPNCDPESQWFKIVTSNRDLPLVSQT